MSHPATGPSRFAAVLLGFVLTVPAADGYQKPSSIGDNAESHHRTGVEYHLRRCLDDASREYDRVLELEPPREPNEQEWQLIRRFAPRLYVTRSEPFPLKDFAAIVHPADRLIAYHLFWEDDIDFPEDNDPCDHELMWVKYSEDRRSIEKIWTYFHGRILEGDSTALAEARKNGMRPRVSVQWGKHGSMPHHWEGIKISPTPGDAELKYYDSKDAITLSRYNEGTFRKLSTEGRRLPNHPLGVRFGWPVRFSGSWGDFIDFSKLIDPIQLLNKKRLAAVTRWNSATINRHLISYNFRPKTEWPTPPAQL